MAFVNRRNKQNTSEVQTESNPVENKSKEIIQNLTPKRETYLDMTIDVLNTLEKQGINVYDKNRVGGMYQRKGMAQQIAIKNLTSTISKNINKTKVTTDTTDTKDNEQDLNKNLSEKKPPVNSLLNFIKKKSG